MRARVCASVGVGLWCGVCVCVRLCWTRVQNAMRCTISTRRYFYYDEHFFFFFFAADAALRRRAAAASFCLCL